MSSCYNFFYMNVAMKYFYLHFTEISTTTITKEEPEHSNISFSKPHLTSSHLSTNTVYFRSSRTSMSSLFTIYVKQSSLKGLSTTVSFTQFSEERSTVLSLSDPIAITSSLSSTPDTTTGTHTEYTSLVITLDSENRTVEYERTINGLTFNVLVLLGT